MPAIGTPLPEEIKWRLVKSCAFFGNGILPTSPATFIKPLLPGNISDAKALQKIFRMTYFCTMHALQERPGPCPVYSGFSRLMSIQQIRFIKVLRPTEIFQKAKLHFAARSRFIQFGLLCKLNYLKMSPCPSCSKAFKTHIHCLKYGE